MRLTNLSKIANVRLFTLLPNTYATASILKWLVLSCHRKVVHIGHISSKVQLMGL